MVLSFITTNILCDETNKYKAKHFRSKFCSYTENTAGLFLKQWINVLISHFSESKEEKKEKESSWINSLEDWTDKPPPIDYFRVEAARLNIGVVAALGDTGAICVCVASSIMFSCISLIARCRPVARSLLIFIRFWCSFMFKYNPIRSSDGAL